MEGEANTLTPLTCESCGTGESKYTCPCCGIRSCSVVCVKAHKAKSGCTGKRNRTEFCKIKEFNDKQLVEDYNFLTEAGDVTDASKRLRSQLKASASSAPVASTRLPPHLYHLVRMASQREVSLMLLPQGMSKRLQNTTNFNGKTKQIHWHVELEFHQADLTVARPKVIETMSIRDIISQWATLKSHPPATRTTVEPFLERLNELLVFLPVIPLPANQRAFIQIDASLPLQDILKGMSVIEFPHFHVALPEDASEFPTKPITVAPKQQHLTSPS